MIRARDFVEAARARGFDFYAGVPCSFLTPFINYVIDDAALTYLSAANEGDALAAAAGAALGGRRGVVMMQNSGLGNAVNPLTSLAHTFRIPLLLVVTLRGEPGLADEPQHALMGRITGALLDTLEIPWARFPEEAAAIAPALARAEAHMAAEQRPYALVMHKGAVAPHALASTGLGTARRRPAPPRAALAGGRPTRQAVLERVVARTPADQWAVLATTGYTGRQLYAVADRPNQLYLVGSMGCASSFGLGLALARPDRRVLVLDGDGAALMRMGNFATLGAYGGANLVHLVLDNGVHESTGGQFTVSEGVSFAGVAAACGYARSLEGDDPALVDEVLGTPGEGPVLLHLRVRPGVPEHLPRPRITPPEVYRRLRAHLGARPGTP